MTLILYGSSRGRASRCLIALEELGLSFAHIPLAPWDRPEEAARLKALNPNARVPVLDDDGLVLWESMAINLYLADRYGGPPLWPEDPRDRARVYQWSLWGQTEVDVMARHRARFSKDPVVKARAEAERLAALSILDTALARRPWLAGETFTLADLNLATTLSEPWENGKVDGELDLAAAGLPALADWLARCASRTSWAAVRKLA